jgi:hypothetical protein
MDSQDINITIQKSVNDYCEKITKNEFIVIVDSFVFYRNYDLEQAKEIFEAFLTEFDIKRTFENHLIDLTGETYFKKTHGANLHFLEDIQTCLLVCSYNKFRNDTVRNNKRRRNRKS